MSQLLRVDLSADTVNIADAGGNVARADRRIALGCVPFLRFSSHRIHIDAILLAFHLADIVFKVLVHGGNIVDVDAGNIKGLTRAKVKSAVAKTLCKLLDSRKILGADQAAGNAHL